MPEKCYEGRNCATVLATHNSIEQVFFNYVKIYYVAYICIVFIEVHWQTIYFEKFTVEETGHFTWPMFGEHDTSIRSTITFKTQTGSLRNSAAYMYLGSYLFLIKVIFVYYMCGYGR